LIALGSPGKTGADQPIQLWLPWEGGTLWTYTQGPHGEFLEALDFQPPDAAGKPCEIFHSSFWVVAAAPGTVTVLPNLIEIDHGDGFSTAYYHLENKQVKTGDHVQTGDRLGAPGCCPDGVGADGCEATAPHVHFYVIYHGVRMPAFGMNLGGWVVNDDGCLERAGERQCPLEGGATRSGALRAGSAGGRIVSNSPRRGQDDPSTPADIAVMIDTSTPVESRTDAALAVLQATRPDDQVAVINFNTTAKVTVPLTTAVQDGGVNNDLADAMNEPTTDGKTNIRLGMVTGCAELLANGKAPARAAVLLSDGHHDAGSFSGAAECFEQAGIPVFTFAVGPSDEEFLLHIANETGGQFARLSDTANPYCEFRRIRSFISGDPVGACTTFQLKKGEALTQPFKVHADQDQAQLEIRWRDRHTTDSAAADGQPVDAQIVSPNGKVLKLPFTGIKYEEDDGAVRFTITYPLEGEWKLVVNLNDSAPAEGLFITFSASTIPQALPFVLQPTPTPEPTQLADTATPEPSPSDTPTPTPSKTGGPPKTPDPMNDRTHTPSPTKPPKTTPSLTPSPSLSPTPSPTAS
jgi:murein DD-endopeptidase MepM/ murein hydrolase activator NlpD